MESFLSDNRAFYCAISADERLTGQETKMDQFVRFTKQDGTVRLFYIILRTFFAHLLGYCSTKQMASIVSVRSLYDHRRATRPILQVYVYDMFFCSVYLELHS